ncbi:zinc finger, CCHC-type, retrotransposon gag domain protein [Tanacetum coccineum]
MPPLLKTPVLDISSKKGMCYGTYSLVRLHNTLDDKEQIKSALGRKSLEEGFQIRYPRSDRQRVYAKCIDDTLEWEKSDVLITVLPPIMDKPQPGRPRNRDRFKSKGEETTPKSVAKAHVAALSHLKEYFGNTISQTIKEELIANFAGQVKEVTYSDFSACDPPSYSRESNPFLCHRWIQDVEGTFDTSKYPDNLRVKFTANLLRGRAKEWWNYTLAAKGLDVARNMSWNEFKELFLQKFSPQAELKNIRRDFLSVTPRQGGNARRKQEWISSQHKFLYKNTKMKTKERKDTKCHNNTQNLMVSLLMRKRSRQ